PCASAETFWRSRPVAQRSEITPPSTIRGLQLGSGSCGEGPRDSAYVYGGETLDLRRRELSTSRGTLAAANVLIRRSLVGPRLHAGLEQTHRLGDASRPFIRVFLRARDPGEISLAVEGGQPFEEG